MADVSEYGTWGSACYDGWESWHERIRHDVKFGGADAETAFIPLKKEIIATVNKVSEKERKMNILLYVSIGLTLIALMVTGGTPMDAPLACAIPGAFAIWRKVTYGKVRSAVVDFDKKYFDGEVCYAIRNGISI